MAMHNKGIVIRLRFILEIFDEINTNIHKIE